MNRFVYPGLYHHPKRNHYYIALGLGHNCTNGHESERAITYFSPVTGKIFYRQPQEFEDGRFVPIYPWDVEQGIQATLSLLKQLIQLG